VDRPAPRRVTGHAALVQFSNPVRQPAVNAIGTTGLGIDQPSHPDGFAHLQLLPGPPFNSKVFTHRRGQITVAHPDVSTAPRIDSPTP